MIKIVYTSGSGSTKKYAEMLSKKTGFECVDLKKAKINEDDEMIYCGWVMMDELQGYIQAKGIGKIKAVVAVGMMDREDSIEKMKKKSAVEEPLFFLMGALKKKDFIEKLEQMLESKMKEEINNPMMSMMLKPMVGMAIKKMMTQFKDGDEKERKMYELIENGFDMVDEERLQPILEFLNA